MAQECWMPRGKTIILACSGGSNVGQLAHQAAVELTMNTEGRQITPSQQKKNRGVFSSRSKDSV